MLSIGFEYGRLLEITNCKDVTIVRLNFPERIFPFLSFNYKDIHSLYLSFLLEGHLDFRCIAQSR